MQCSVCWHAQGLAAWAARRGAQRESADRGGTLRHVDPPRCSSAPRERLSPPRCTTPRSPFSNKTPSLLEIRPLSLGCTLMEVFLYNCIQ